MLSSSLYVRVSHCTGTIYCTVYIPDLVLNRAASCVAMSSAADCVRQCAKEVVIYCGGLQGGNNIDDCLYSHRSALSERCGNCLLAIKSGLCELDAATLCSEYYEVADVRACLLRSVGIVTPSCRENLLRGSSRNILFDYLQSKIYQRTSLVVFMTTMYAMILGSAVLWVWYKARCIQAVQKQFKASQRLKYGDFKRDTEASDRSRGDCNNGRFGSLSIDLLGLSYRRADLLGDVFRDVTCSFRSGTVTAISGPGAHLLVAVLSGVSSGEGVSQGEWVVDSTQLTERQYRRFAQTQGIARFVAPPCLTVWQQFLRCALLHVQGEGEGEEGDAAMKRAFEVMVEVGLQECADIVPFDAVWSGGELCGRSQSTIADSSLAPLQLRCLAVGLEVVREPRLLVCHGELFIGLDVKDTIALVELLYRLSRRHHATILMCLANTQVLSVLSTLDQIVLLGEGGQMVCAGSPADIAELVTSSHCSGGGVGAQESVEDSLRRVLDLEGERAGSSGTAALEDEAAVSLLDAHSSCGVEMKHFTTSSGAAAGSVQAVIRDRHTKRTAEKLLHAAQRRLARGEVIERLGDLVHTAEGELSGRGGRSGRGRVSGSGASKVAPLTQVSVHVSVALEVCRVARHNLAYLGVIVALFVIIFVWAKLLPLHLQQEWNEAELSASLLVALTWSVLVLEVIRSRVLLPPTEDLLRNARGSAWAQMLAQVMVDFPYALIMSAVALSAAYASHRLNPNSVNAAFATACLVIGLSAWQATTAFIFLAARCSRLAFLALFLLLAVSVLCNGQLIPIRSLPWVLQCGAYVLPPALLQRALVANDLQCCYLTLTCNALRLGHFSTPKCPAGLRFSGDGSDEGNLGRSFLEVQGLEGDRPLLLLFVLLLHGLVWRFSAASLIGARKKKGTV